MKVGTKSVLWGYHAFWLHWIPTLVGWYNLYGIPKKWWEWVAIFIHDLGYLGSPNMDGEEGTRHPYNVARKVRWLSEDLYREILLHSRTIVVLLGEENHSRLCAADKLGFTYYPYWLLRVLYILSGEGDEYIQRFTGGQLQRWRHYQGNTNTWQLWFRWANASNVEFLKKEGLWNKITKTEKNRINLRCNQTKFALMQQP